MDLAAEHFHPTTKSHVYVMTNAEMQDEITERDGTYAEGSTKAELAKTLCKLRKKVWHANGPPTGPDPIISVADAAAKALESEFISLGTHIDPADVGGPGEHEAEDTGDAPVAAAPATADDMDVAGSAGPPAQAAASPANGSNTAQGHFQAIAEEHIWNPTYPMDFAYKN